MNEPRGTAPGNPAEDSPWPDLDDGMIVFLLDARDRFEAGLLHDWIERHKPAAACPPYSVVALPARDADGFLGDLAGTAGPVWLQPLRIAWLPAPGSGGSRSLQGLFYSRIASPGALRRRWLAKKQPERVAHIAGDGAFLHDLRERYTGSGAGAMTPDGLEEFIAGQALITLERSERIIRGARYKVSRILPGDVFANEAFQEGLANAAQQRDRSLPEVRRDAARYLEEMAAMQTPFTLDMITALYRASCKSHHDAEIGVDEAQLEAVAQTLATRPVIFLISHKSMLDTMALSLVLFDRNLPLPLTFGGINLRTPGLGALARRGGIIFLRRSFQDNEIYKATFRRYIDYLIEKRFSLLWALEGTRSRTGKLLPPRFGLFNYVVESILRTRLYDVTFVPVSVAYDQITEVEDYATEQRGRKKKPEGMTWALRFLKRGKSRGQIHLRFGQSLTLTDIVDREELDRGIDERRKQTVVPTLAFEVAVRMNAATPITATAIITLILLAGGNRAQSLDQVQSLARIGAALIRQRKLEIVGRSRFRDADAVRATLAELQQTGIVQYLDEGTERLYTIGADQHLNAAYYRNTAIHYFILDAFVEIALLDAAADTGDPREAFFRTAAELRELFKFEFYFPRRAEYPAEIESRVSDRIEDWETALQNGEAGGRAALEGLQLLVAHAVLRSFVDAYRVVAKVLAGMHGDAATDKAAVISQCLKAGKQSLLQGSVFSAESVSKSLYANAIKLADYRGLLKAGQADARSELHRQLRNFTSRLDTILAITLARAKEP